MLLKRGIRLHVFIALPLEFFHLCAPPVVVPVHDDRAEREAERVGCWAVLGGDFAARCASIFISNWNFALDLNEIFQ